MGSSFLEIIANNWGATYIKVLPILGKMPLLLFYIGNRSPNVPQSKEDL